MKMELKSRTQKSAANFVTSIGGQLLSTLLGFVARTVFIHILGESYLGINGLFSDILTMLNLTELGFDTALTFKLYKPIAEKDYKRVRLLMKFFRKAYFAVGVVILALGLCVIPLLPVLIRDYNRLAELGINAVAIYLVLLFNNVSSYWFFAYRGAVVHADQKDYKLTIFSYFTKAGTTVLQIILLVKTRNFMVYTVSAVVLGILLSCVRAIYIRQMYPQVFVREQESISKKEVGELFKDCGALFVYKANNAVLKASDNLVLSAFIGVSIVGLYSNYLLFFTTIRSFVVTMFNSVKASMGNLYATADTEVNYRFFEIINLLTVIFYGTGCVGISVVANELISCWIGTNYVIAQPFPVLIGIELLFSGLVSNLGQVRNISGAFRQMWLRPLLSVIINIVVSIALVGSFGIYGVIFGTIVSRILTNFLVDPYVIHKYAYHNYRPVSYYYRKNVGYIIVLFLVCALDMFLCAVILPGLGWISVIIHSFICGISVPAAFLLIYRNKPETKYLFRKGTDFLKKGLKNGVG